MGNERRAAQQELMQSLRRGSRRRTGSTTTLQESIEFWEAFPDQHLDNGPYKVFFASGD
jgi:hypothetical protein